MLVNRQALVHYVREKTHAVIQTFGRLPDGDYHTMVDAMKRLPGVVATDSRRFGSHEHFVTAIEQPHIGGEV
jgi:hypothetical protein